MIYDSRIIRRDVFRYNEIRHISYIEVHRATMTNRLFIYSSLIRTIKNVEFVTNIYTHLSLVLKFNPTLYSINIIIQTNRIKRVTQFFREG